MVINIGPVLIALLGGFSLGEGFPPRLMAGIAVSFTGAARTTAGNMGVTTYVVPALVILMS